MSKVRLLWDWLIDWVILPWFQPNPGKKREKRDKREDDGQS